MIVTRNATGMNKAFRHNEISTNLKKLKCGCLARTRVKKPCANRIRNKLGICDDVDNYAHHVNGRNWPLWNSGFVEFKLERSLPKFIHGSFHRKDGTMICWLTVYAFNQEEEIV